MRRISLRVSLLAGAAASFAACAPAAAESLAGAEIRARAAGGEFRGDTFTFRGFESHVWRFAADGSAASAAVARRSPGNYSSTAEFGDAGRWRVEGDRLCVDWAGPNRQFSGCYAVEGQPGIHVRLVGPTRWEGTLER